VAEIEVTAFNGAKKKTESRGYYNFLIPQTENGNAEAPESFKNGAHPHFTQKCERFLTVIFMVSRSLYVATLFSGLHITGLLHAGLRD